MTFVDTNYFLRFLLKDVDSQHQKAKELFRRAVLGQEKLFTSVIVFFEIYWVLSSFYGKDKPELIETLRKILALEFIKLGQRELLEEALQTFSDTSLELEDAFNLAYAKNQQANRFQTFDKKLQREFRRAGK